MWCTQILPAKLKMDKFKKLREDFEAEDVYLGISSALQHTLDFDDYIKCKKKDSDGYVSLLFVFNTSGCDKKMLSLFGTENIDTISSIPVKCYVCEQPTVTLSAVQELLENWNITLESEGRYIKLLINLPISSSVFNYSNIKVESLFDKCYDPVNQQTENIVKCFKYHYRKAQIIKHIIQNKYTTKLGFIDYVNMMISAWHNVSKNYIHHMFYPYEDGSPNIEEEERLLSLGDWCVTYNVPFDFQSDFVSLDDFLNIDKDLYSFNANGQHCEVIFKAVESTSAIETYQAIKRLLSYLQGEGVNQSAINSAKSLEDLVEVGALLEMQHVASITKNSSAQ